MNSFGILDLALPFAAVALFACWIGIKRLLVRRARGSADPSRGGGAGARQGTERT